MDHLDDARLDALFSQDTPLTTVEAIHVEGCELCRIRIDAYRLLEAELAIARQSAPTPQQLAKYSRLFDEVPVQNLARRLGGFLDTLRLSLALDSRQSASALGLRRAAGFGHRLLYSNEQVDVELLLEPEGEKWDIEGDILLLDPDAMSPPYRIELFVDQQDIDRGYRVESDDGGRFRLADIVPGTYDLTLTPARGSLIEIVGLEIP